MQGKLLSHCVWLRRENHENHKTRKNFEFSIVLEGKESIFTVGRCIFHFEISRVALANFAIKSITVVLFNIEIC